MADAYQSAKGDLIDRLVASLETAQKEGGKLSLFNSIRSS
jgi:uncharacterized Ntn-hydrolase superfamily protein